MCPSYTQTHKRTDRRTLPSTLSPSLCGRQKKTVLMLSGSNHKERPLGTCYLAPTNRTTCIKFWEKVIATVHHTQDSPDHCPMPINTNQCISNFWNWSEIPFNADWSVCIGINNANSIGVGHWSTLGIDHGSPADHTYIHMEREDTCKVIKKGPKNQSIIAKWNVNCFDQLILVMNIICRSLFFDLWLHQTTEGSNKWKKNNFLINPFSDWQWCSLKTRRKFNYFTSRKL